jgi:hypothetical protein
MSRRVVILAAIFAAAAVFLMATLGRGGNPLFIALTFPAALPLPLFARAPGFSTSPPVMATVGWLLYVGVGAAIVTAERKSMLILFSVLFALMLAFNMFVIVLMSALHGLQ